MYDRYFAGLKLSSALVLMLIATGLILGACRSDKGEKTEKAADTESAVVATPEPQPTEAPAGETGETDKQSREGMPPEITEPCSGKNEGDPCSVTITSGAEIKGKCAMTRKNILGCMPTPIIGEKKQAPGMSPTDENGASEEQPDSGE